MKIKRDEKITESLMDKGKNGDPPSSKQYNLRLKSAEDVRRMLSVALNDLRRGKANVQVVRTLIYGGQVLLGVFEQTELGERVKRLESRNSYGGQQR